MAITDQWDLFNRLNNQNQNNNLPLPSGLQFEPLPLPTINTTPAPAPAAEDNKKKSGWERFGDFLQAAAPGLLIGLTASNPIAGGSTIDAWNQAKAAKQQADAQQFLRDLQMKNYLLNQEKFEYGKRQNALEQARQDYLDKFAEEAAKAKAEQEAAKAAEDKRRWEEEQRLKWYEATHSKPNKEEDPLLISYKDLDNAIKNKNIYDTSGDAARQRYLKQYSAAIRANINDPEKVQQYIDRYNYLAGTGFTYDQWVNQSQRKYNPATNRPVAVKTIQLKNKKTGQQKSNQKSAKTVMIYDPKTGNLVRKNED
jgi:hypothetical protein